MTELFQWMMPPLMLVEMLIGAWLVGKPFEKKEFFLLRYVGGGVIGIVNTLWIEGIYAIVTGTYFIYEGTGDLLNTCFKIGYYLVIFIIAVSCIATSYRMPFITALVCASVGYAIQHIAANNATILMHLVTKTDTVEGHLIIGIIYIVIRVATYLVIYHCLLKKNYDNLIYTGNNYKKSILSIAVIVICIGLSRLVNDGLTGRSLINDIAYALYSTISCILIIAFQFDLFKTDAMQSKMDIMAELLHQEKEYYKLSKENIELINIKYHDLKHQLSALRENYSEESLAEIEEAVSFYGSTIKTGNDVLDVVLTQKKLQCEAQHIQFICMAKGELLDFMEDMDMHSLFGNALSNAIESVIEESDESKRHISLKVVNTMNMCSVHIENYFVGELQLEDGIPLTKKEPNFHGFGMRSMLRIVDKYNGVLTVSQSENKFNLDILFPLS